MKSFTKKLVALCMGVMIVVGCASPAWAEEPLTDIGEMAIFVDGTLATGHPEVVYEGEPVEPAVIIVPPFSQEKLEMLEIPTEARSVVVYQYEITPIGGASAIAAEVTSFDSDGICLSTNMFAKFDQNAPAEAFLKIIERDYGTAFMKGSVNDATTYALIDMRSSFLDRTTYEKALHELLIAPAVDLVEGRDYTATYANNDKPGKATVTVTGKGDYRGAQTVGFTILGEGSGERIADADAAVSNAGSKSATALLGYVLLGFLVVAVAVIAIVLWRGAKSEDTEDRSESDSARP